MKLLAMNNPYRNLVLELEFLGGLDLDGVELTIEAPESHCEQVAALDAAQREQIKILHTRYDLPLAHESEQMRKIALSEFRRAAEVGSHTVCTYINIHPHRGTPGISREQLFELNIEAFRRAVSIAREFGLELIIENQPPFPAVSDFERIFNEVPEAYLLLDLAHAVCHVDHDEALRFISTFGERIRHVHLCDNFGDSDDHLFIGHGTLDFESLLSELVHKVHPPCMLSLEPFSVLDNGLLRVASQRERESLLQESITRLRALLGETSRSQKQPWEKTT